VPYAYDPAVDEQESPDEEDQLHDPADMTNEKKAGIWGMRGFLNVGVLLLILAALLVLFIFYPVMTFLRDNARNESIDGNIRINATRQAPVL
jgi:beta-glucan synthesis-associated protein KRE6